LFVSLREGMGSLQQALAGQVKLGATVRSGANVRRIYKDAAGRFRLLVTSGDAAESDEAFDAVVVAVPSYVAADLTAAWQPDLAARLREIEYASSAIVVTGHRLADVAHPLDAYGLVVPRVEQRRILAVSFLSRKFPDRAPADRVVLRTFVGGALQPELMSLSNDELVLLVREELRDVLGVRGEPEVCRVVRYERAMPQYHVGHLDRVRRIEELAATTNGLALCGNAYHGVGLPDCIHDGEEAAERVWKILCPPGEPGT
jgi:oxygen-dependent protoporphyrinogen oxidase